MSRGILRPMAYGAVGKFAEGVKDDWKSGKHLTAITEMIVVAVIVIGFLIGVFAGIKSLVTSPASTSVQAAQSNIAIGNTATVTQTLNVNQEAKYNWINEKTWRAQAGDGQAAGVYQVNLVFLLDGPVVPVSPCLYITADAKLKSVGPIGYVSSWATGKKGPATINCFLGLSSNVTFQAFFESRPTKINAELIQDDRGLKLQQELEQSFTLPVISG